MKNVLFFNSSLLRPKHKLGNALCWLALLCISILILFGSLNVLAETTTAIQNVNILVIEDATIEGKGADSVTQLAIDLPNFFRKALIKQGFRVITNPDKPYDFEAKLRAEVDSSYAVFNARVVFKQATLILEKDGYEVVTIEYSSNDIGGNWKTYGAEGEQYAIKATTSYVNKLMQSSTFASLIMNRQQVPSKLQELDQPRSGVAVAGIHNSAPAIPIVKSDVDDLPTKKAKANKSAYAIVIGIEQYRQKLPKADFATHDAQTMTDYLTRVMGYPEENVVTLLNDRATKSDFEKYFGKWLSNNVEKGGSVFVYYSGHGAPNTKTGDAYLVPYDGDPAFIDETGYSLNKLYEQLGKLEAKEIVVALDSCFSGAGGRSVIAKGARPLVMNMKTSAIPAKVVVLSASSGEQISSTYDEKGHGLFTYFMLKGLKGEAETNGSVEIGNLFEYIKPQVERIARKSYNNEQTPQLIAPKELVGMKLR